MPIAGGGILIVSITVPTTHRFEALKIGCDNLLRRSGDGLQRPRRARALRSCSWWGRPLAIAAQCISSAADLGWHDRSCFHNLRSRDLTIPKRGNKQTEGGARTGQLG
jgi:hypothetical protein